MDYRITKVFLIFYHLFKSFAVQNRLESGPQLPTGVFRSGGSKKTNRALMIQSNNYHRPSMNSNHGVHKNVTKASTLDKKGFRLYHSRFLIISG